MLHLEHIATNVCPGFVRLAREAEAAEIGPSTRHPPGDRSAMTRPPITPQVMWIDGACTASAPAPRAGSASFAPRGTTFMPTFGTTPSSRSLPWKGSSAPTCLCAFVVCGLPPSAFEIQHSSTGGALAARVEQCKAVALSACRFPQISSKTVTTLRQEQTHPDYASC